MSWVIKGSKPYVKLTDTDTAHDVNIQNDGTELKLDNDILISKATPSTKLNDTGSGTTATISYDGTNINVDHDVKHTGTGASLLAHASRHDRGGADAIDWSSISKFHVATGVSASVGVSGSPASTTVLTLDTNYYNLLPLTVKVTPSGLGTGETLTISVVAKGSDGNSYTLASKSGVSSAVTFTPADFDFTVLADGIRITELDVSIESSATSTSATATVDVAALEF